VRVRVAHTADLSAGVLEAVRVLLEDAFDGDFGSCNWDHALGGMHALVLEDGAPVAHASVVQRRLLHGGRALRTGYVEGVAVRADRRGHGRGAAVMEEAERIIREGYELGALGTTEVALPFYAARGWQRWAGPTSALTPDGVVRTPDDDGGIFVLPVTAELDLSAPLTCDWRDGEVW
jgi:aminoglycoside 2'-N-acetyltransferase I